MHLLQDTASFERMDGPEFQQPRAVSGEAADILGIVVGGSHGHGKKHTPARKSLFSCPGSESDTEGTSDETDEEEAEPKDPCFPSESFETEGAVLLVPLEFDNYVDKRSYYRPAGGRSSQSRIRRRREFLLDDLSGITGALGDAGAGVGASMGMRRRRSARGFSDDEEGRGGENDSESDSEGDDEPGAQQ
ncbi:unnamed protein product [Pseudo-nitzschia multistriata]|uniref:Uncharacterized protein n=1 Tax=Pseudo-nitzschia multistriata TaxID=183589 RepID=A0A448Z5G2_9STRA|nr:unnamed protein product [Pseudo-nitzschia multistriata]